MRTVATAAMVIGAIVTSTGVATAHAEEPQAPIVANGSFEEPDVGAYEFFDDRIPGWTVTSGEIEIIDQSIGSGFQARSGSQVLAFNEPGTASQNVPTTPGLRYRLTFHLAREADATGPITLDVTLGDATERFTVPLDQTGYREEAIEFTGTASASATRIAFASDNPTEAGPVVDDVAVEVLDAPVR